MCGRVSHPPAPPLRFSSASSTLPHVFTSSPAQSHSSLINNPSRRSADSRSKGGSSVAITATRTRVLILLQGKHLFMCRRRWSWCQHGGLGRRRWDFSCFKLINIASRWEDESVVRPPCWLQTLVCRCHAVGGPCCVVSVKWKYARGCHVVAAGFFILINAKMWHNYVYGIRSEFQLWLLF